MDINTNDINHLFDFFPEGQYYLDQSDDAKRDCLRSIEYNPRDIEACRTLTRIYLSKNDYPSVKFWENRIHEIEEKLKQNHTDSKGI